MKPTERYLKNLNEDFSFNPKKLKANIVKKISQNVKSSINGNRVNKPMLMRALKPIPSLSSEKIDNFADKYLPNYKQNKQIALNYFNKKYPGKENNDIIAKTAGMIASGKDDKSIQMSIKDVDRVYSRGGQGGGAFVLMVMGLFAAAGAWSFDELDIKMRGLAFALGGLLILASFKSLIATPTNF